MINCTQFQTKYNSFSNNFTQIAKIFSTSLAFYCSIKLLDAAMLKISQIFFPDLLDLEEQFKRELADLRTDCVGPLESAKITFLTICFLLKINNLYNVVGVNTKKKEFKSIRKELEAIKKRLTLLETQSISSEKLEGLRSLGDLRSFEVLDVLEDFTRLREFRSPRGLTLPTETKNFAKSAIKLNSADESAIEVTRAALEVVNLVTPHTAIRGIVGIGKVVSELIKPLESQNKLNISQKIFKIVGHTGKTLAEFTPFPALGKTFANAILITGSLLKLINTETENAA